MKNLRKITVEVPSGILELAQKASGDGIARTVRLGLQLVAASETYAQLRKLRGRVRFAKSARELKCDR